MIFTKTWQQVLDGSKTQTRRPVKEDEYAENQHGYILPIPVFGEKEIDSVYSALGAKKWQVFRTYAVQPGRGKKAVGRIRIKAIVKRELLEIVPSQIFAEGIRLEEGATIEDYIVAFAQLWNSIYKKPYRWENNPEVWILEFEVADE